jgi:RHS repeat-associated protein
MEDYVYRDGLLLGADRPAEEGGRRYMHLDHLGTPRLVTGGNGVKVAEHELAPFGIEPTPLWEDTTHGFDREDPMRFTGHERDFAQLSRMVTTPYLDYMHARYHNPGVGRFLSVDPVVNAASAAGSPQRWNRYSYSLNNPLRYLDPDGRDPQESVKRFLLIGYLLYSHGLLDPKIHFTVASKSPIAKKALGGVGVKGLDYFGVDVTDSLNKGSKNSLDITYQNDGLGVETVLSFNGIVPTLDELYATGGPFEKSLFSKDEDKLSLGVALAGGVTVEQKLDKLLPVLFEYMSMSTEELIVEVAEQLDKEGYRIIDGQLVLLKQKK